ncbi:tyrosine-type recombinase/integrase [Thermodesulfobacteriota bacterium]
MLGGIYSNQRCPACESKFKDDGKKGLFCLKHPEYQARKYFVRFKGGIFKRFENYQSAQRFITGLRYKYDEGSFDERDYKQENPLGFENLATQWLDIKKEEVKKSSFIKIQNHINRAIKEWRNKNIKEIGYAEIEDFLLSQKIEKTNEPISAKTKSNIKSTLHSFWIWLKKRRILSASQIPEFPETPFELSWRKTIDKEIQQGILDEIYNISFHINPKIWIGIKFLSTYISIRPGEMLNIKEGDFDLNLGVVVITNPKEKKPKTVPLLEEDIGILNSFPRGLPDIYFFRHQKGRSGVKAGERFGEKYLYKWWKKACDNLGIDGVDLYGGTRHSSARALREFNSPEEIKRATMHTTNKAFERYFQIELEDVRNIYGNTKKGKRKYNDKKEEVSVLDHKK